MFVVIVSAVSKYLKVLNRTKGPVNKIIHIFYLNPLPPFLKLPS